MWQFQHTEFSTAEPQQLWELYRRPHTWPSWDPSTRRVEVDGPFESGTTGVIHPTSGPRLRFVLTEVTPLLAFTNQSRLPLTRLSFTHRLRPVDGGTCFTHGVRLDGALAWLFGPLIGRQIARDLPGAMLTLAATAAGTR